MTVTVKGVLHMTLEDIAGLKLGGWYIFQWRVWEYLLAI